MAFANPSQPNLPDFWAFIRDSMEIPSPALAGPIGTPSPPILTAGSGGSLPTETVYVKVTYVSAYGETLASTEASMSVTGQSGTVTVTSPATVTGATGYNVYAAALSGSETLQTTTPIAIGIAYIIASLAAGASPPTADTSGSTWAAYSLTQAEELVIQMPCGGIGYTLATYNCAGHILLKITPDQPGQSYFSSARTTFGLLNHNPGVVTSAGDQGTSGNLTVPRGVADMTISDLNFFTTPWGREYISWNQSFGDVWGLT